MPRNLTPLGHARVYRHPATGELVVDTDSLRRSSFAGEFDEAGFGYEDDFGDEDFDGEDEFEGDDEDFGDDDFEGDGFGDEDFDGEDDFGDDEFGDRSSRRARRRARKRRRLERRMARLRRKMNKLGGSRKKKAKKTMQWGMTAVGGTDSLTAAGSASVKIRLQHHFQARDITFTGSADGAKVTSIFFGDRVVWSNSDGIDVGVFASTGFLRGLLKGQSLRAGLDITVNGTLPGAGDFAVTLIGLKPVGPC